jgi:hypothetical protein
MAGQQAIDWAGRWLGGFCALGATGGLPIRGISRSPQLPLAAQLTLPSDWPTSPASAEAATAAWMSALGRPVLLVASVERARTLLLAARELPVGGSVWLPANATLALVEAVKRAGGKPCFRAAATDGAMGTAKPDDGLICAEPIGGLGLIGSGVSASWIDCADTVPAPGRVGLATDLAGLTLWGLHLERDGNRGGGVLALTNPDQPGALGWWAALEQLVQPEDAPDPARALAQCRRLDAMAPRQEACLAEVWRGLSEAAGLELFPLPGNGALVQQIAVRIPAECDPATFYAYVGGENTPVDWLPLVRPLNSAAIASLTRQGVLRSSAKALAEWILVPVGPDYDEIEISQTILGVVKAAEYLGVRWRTRPAEAAEYAAWLAEVYGPDHDAYRPVFELPEALGVSGS